MKPPPENLNFDTSYFSLGYFERLIAKGVLLSILILILVVGLVLFVSPLYRSRLIGFLFVVFVIETIGTILKGESQITSEVIRLVKERPIQVNRFLNWKTFSLLDKALARAEVKYQQFYAALFFELIHEREIRKGIEKLGQDWYVLRETARSVVQGGGKDLVDSLRHDIKKQNLRFVSDLVKHAFVEAVEFREDTISPSSLFIALLNDQNPELHNWFSQLGFSAQDFRNAVIFGRLARGVGKQMMRRRAVAAGRFHRATRVMNRAWTARPTPYLDSVSEDLTEIARRYLIGFLVGHAEAYQSLVNILSREARNNVLLVGEEEVGKTTIVEHLAYNIVKDNVPVKLFDKRLVKVDIGQITSGAQTAGEVQERFRRLSNELLMAGNIVLFIPDIHNLKLTVGREEIGGFEILEPLFSGSVVPVVGTTTAKLYRTLIEVNQNFKDLFEVIEVEELSFDETIRLLIYESFGLEHKWKIVISYPAIKKTVELAYRFLHSKPLPRASLDLLQEALIEAQQRGEKILLADLVTELVSRKTNIPIKTAKGEEAKILLNLEEEIHKKLVNQEKAVSRVAAALRQYRTGLSREKGPIATFLFVGPTGVGKTELSKVIAELYFGSEETMIRFDMSGYQDQKAIWNFIGSPDGAIYGMLTEAVKSNPFSLILLDEFEKAHPNLLDLFLPIFDEGRIKDNLGQEVDFKNTIIICTSNAHSNFIKQQIEAGKTIAEFENELKNKLTEYFKPELLNRFDAIIAFRQLSFDEINQIAKLQLEKLQKQVAQTQNITIEFDNEVYAAIARLGYDPAFGARPLRGVIATHIKDQLARQILEGSLKSGMRVRAVIRQGDIVFEKR